MFQEMFCTNVGPLSLQQLSIEKIRAGRARYTVTLANSSRPAGSRTEKITIESTGAVSALTQVLADARMRIEICEFHQYSIYEATATIIYAMHNNTRIWAVGFGPTPEISAANAMINAANRLH